MPAARTMLHSALPTSREFIRRIFQSLVQPVVDPTANTGVSNPLNSVPESTRKQLLALHVLFPNEFLPALDLLDRRLVTRFRIHDNWRLEARAAGPQATSATNASLKIQTSARAETAEALPWTADEGADLEQRCEVSGSNFTIPRAAGYVELPDVESLCSKPLISHPEGRPDISQIADEQMRTAQEAGDLAAQYEARNNEVEEEIGRDTVHYVHSSQQRSSRFSTSYNSITSYEVRLSAWYCSCPAFAFAAFPSTYTDPVISTSCSQDERSGVKNAISEDGKGDQGVNWSFGGVSLGAGTPPVCKHLLACVLVERCKIFEGFVQEEDVSIEEAAGWAAGWGD